LRGFVGSALSTGSDPIQEVERLPLGVEPLDRTLGAAGPAVAPAVEDAEARRGRAAAPGGAGDAALPGDVGLAGAPVRRREAGGVVLGRREDHLRRLVRAL